MLVQLLVLRLVLPGMRLIQLMSVQTVMLMVMLLLVGLLVVLLPGMSRHNFGVDGAANAGDAYSNDTRNEAGDDVCSTDPTTYGNDSGNAALVTYKAGDAG